MKSTLWAVLLVVVLLPGAATAQKVDYVARSLDKTIVIKDGRTTTVRTPGTGLTVTHSPRPTYTQKRSYQHGQQQSPKQRDRSRR